MAIEKQLNTRIQLKYDSLSNWNEHSGVILKKGEIALCAVPTGGSAVAGDLNRPQVLFKVGDGSSTFANLPWASALAADVHAWAKQANLPVIKEGSGNVVTGISWDAENKAIKYTTDTMATATEFADLVKDLEELTEKVNAMYTNAKIDELVADAKKAGTDAASALATYKTSNDQAVAEAKQAGTDAAAALETYKGTNDQAVATINTNITNIVNGTTPVAKATQATNDGNGNDIAATYQTIENATQQHTTMSGKIEDLEEAVEAINGDDGILAQAKAYADQAETDAITSANGYTDGKIATLKTEVVSNTTFSEFKTTNTQAIADAEQAAKDYAQGAIDTLAAKVGEVPADKTVVQMISDAQTAATYDDTKVKADIQTNANAIAANKTELEGKINAKVAQADYDTKMGQIDETTESLQTQINTIMNNPDTEGVINSINEFTQYISDHGEIAEGFRTDIDANKKAISDHEALATQTYETKEDAVAKYDELTELVNTKAVQADWNVNDETSPAYIKNRICYEDVTRLEYLVDWTVTTGGQLLRQLTSVTVEDNDRFEITVGDTKYSCTAHSNADGLIELVWDGAQLETFTVNAANKLSGISPYVDEPTLYSVICYRTAGVVQLNEKFIPDTIARVADVNAVESELAGRLDAVEAQLGDGEGSVADMIAVAKTELEGKIADAETAAANQAAVVLAEAQKASAAAEEAAKAYTDEVAGNYTEGVEGEDGYKAASGLRKEIAEAQAAANKYTDDEVTALRTELEGADGAIRDRLDALEGDFNNGIANEATKVSNALIVTLEDGTRKTFDGSDEVTIDLTNLATKAYADQAETDAIASANNHTNSEISTLKTSLEQADADLDGRVTTLETNHIKTITAGDGLKVTPGTNSATIAFDDECVFIINCGSSTELV